MARALYQSKDFDLYLLDDPFSSLDVHVSKKVYENCILNFLSDKTIILCTNQSEYFHNADKVVVLENGCIKMIGKPNEVLKEINKNQLNLQLNTHLIENFDNKSLNVEQFDNEFKEEMNKGRVKSIVYLTYLKAIGIPLAILVISFIILMQSSKTTPGMFIYFNSYLQIIIFFLF